MTQQRRYPYLASRITRYQHYIASFTTAVLLALSSATHAAAFDAELAYTYDDNVTRGARDVDILKDQFVAAAAGMSWLQWLNTNHRIVYRGFLRGEMYDKYEGLSNVGAGGQITYQYRESGEFTAPTYGAFFRGSIVEFDSELRDSNFYTLGVSWRKPITDRLTFFTQLSGNMRDSDSTVFDTKDVSLLANLDYAIGSSWTLYTTLNYLDGDIVSTADSSVYGTLPLVNAAEAINPDDAFPEAGGTRVAYRLNGSTIVATLGTNFRISEQHSLDLSARYAKAEADAGIEYDRWLFTMAYLARF